MWELSLAIRHRGCPVSDTSEEVPSIRIQTVSKAGQTGERSKRLIALDGDPTDIERFVEAFGAHEMVGWIDRISEGQGPLQYFSTSVSYAPDNPGIIDILDAHGCYQHTAVAVSLGIEYWIVYLEERNDGKDIIDDIESYDNDVEVVRRVDLTDISEVATLGYAALLVELTPRQREAFRVALEMGYYDDETDVVIDDVADALGLHRTTTWEHVKKARNVILNEVGTRLFPQASKTSELPDAPTR